MVILTRLSYLSFYAYDDFKRYPSSGMPYKQSSGLLITIKQIVIRNKRGSKKCQNMCIANQNTDGGS